MVNARPGTLVEAFQRTAGHNPDAVAVRTPGGGTTITWRQYVDEVRRIATGLSALGVRTGDTVAIMLTNRPEFHLVDTGALHAGATPFSIYNTLAPEQINYVLTDAGSRVVVCEQQFVEKLRNAIVGTAVEYVVCVDDTPEGTIGLGALPTETAFDFEATWRSVQPDDVLTIIYTSGTTGSPKGVELTHANMIASVDATLDTLPINVNDRVVSYLPDAHVANRWGAHYTSMVTGMQITTVADPKEMLGALTDVRPTFFGAVPQIWYKLKAAIEANLAAEENETKRKLAHWALHAAQRKARLSAKGKPVPLTTTMQAALADRLVLSRVRTALGLDQIRIAASGAAPIAPEALEFVLALGIPVCELWGMSETSGAATMNPPGGIRIGTVGPPVKGMEAKLADDGELLVRGPLVMRGYRNNREKTSDTIDADGWLHTGDIATIDSDGYVSIVDRKKELIINAAGKNMSPANIENAVKVASPLIGSVAAIGDNRPYVVALVTLDPDACAAYGDADPATLAADPGVNAAVAAAVETANSTLARVEQIKKFAILPAFWEPGSAELTPTMKLKRKPIEQKYATEIDALYT
ncbi:long-chain fatty acid--CoA ligase [Haloechinothrix salitolerans]|uniref:Acyl-CoA synthetase n=1 Tax=Haloechinothrix salitolerans TaxID=926830 RepID=A0ABW2C8N9_9PSEU